MAASAAASTDSASGAPRASNDSEGSGAEAGSPDVEAASGAATPVPPLRWAGATRATTNASSARQAAATAIWKARAAVTRPAPDRGSTDVGAPPRRPSCRRTTPVAGSTNRHVRWSASSRRLPLGDHVTSTSTFPSSDHSVSPVSGSTACTWAGPSRVARYEDHAAAGRAGIRPQLATAHGAEQHAVAVAIQGERAPAVGRPHDRDQQAAVARPLPATPPCRSGSVRAGDRLARCGRRRSSSPPRCRRRPRPAPTRPARPRGRLPACSRTPLADHVLAHRPAEQDAGAARPGAARAQHELLRAERDGASHVVAEHLQPVPSPSRRSRPMRSPPSSKSTDTRSPPGVHCSAQVRRSTPWTSYVWPSSQGSTARSDAAALAVQQHLARRVHQAGAVGAPVRAAIVSGRRCSCRSSRARPTPRSGWRGPSGRAPGRGAAASRCSRRRLPAPRRPAPQGRSRPGARRRRRPSSPGRRRAPRPRSRPRSAGGHRNGSYFAGNRPVSAASPGRAARTTAVGPYRPAAMAQRDYYDVLGVERGAGDDELKRAFRALARQHHPDVNPDDPAAGERFREVAEAYEVLSNAETRALYDRYGHAGVSGRPLASERAYQSGNIADIFSMLFGEDLFGGGAAAQRRGPMAGADAQADVELDLVEAAFGARKEIVVEVLATCDHCHGSGAEPPSRPTRCPTCRGQGHVQQVARTMFGQMVRTSPCPTCRGRGMVVETRCRTCRGQGRRPERRTVSSPSPAAWRAASGCAWSGRGTRASPGRGRQPLRTRGRARRPALRARRRRPHLRGRPDHDPGRARLRGRGADAGGLGADRVQARHPARRGAGAAQSRRPGAAWRPARRHQGAGERARAAAPRRGPAARGRAARHDAGRPGLRRRARTACSAGCGAPAMRAEPALRPSPAWCATPCACRRRRPDGAGPAAGCVPGRAGGGARRRSRGARGLPADRRDAGVGGGLELRASPVEPGWREAWRAFHRPCGWGASGSGRPGASRTPTPRPS